MALQSRENKYFEHPIFKKNIYTSLTLFHPLFKSYSLWLCREGGINCHLCDENGALHQYAHEATSPHACDSTGYWTPEEAVG